MKEMTREDKLYSMRMQELKMVADKLGIKINTKAAKSIAVEKILAAEEMNKKNEKEITKKKAENDAYVAEVMKQKKDLGIKCPPIKSVELVSTSGTNEKTTPKRGELITYNGKAQNICAWAKELGKSPNTLYGRIYKLGWTVEKAFTK